MFDSLFDDYRSLNTMESCQYAGQFVRRKIHVHGIFTGRNEVVAKVMFLHVCVILFTGGVSGQQPWDQAATPLRDQADTPSGPRRTPPGTRQPPWDQQTPPDQGEPPWEEDFSIRSMSGRYASYWNAFFFQQFFHSISNS